MGCLSRARSSATAGDGCPRYLPADQARPGYRRCRHGSVPAAAADAARGRRRLGRRPQVADLPPPAPRPRRPDLRLPQVPHHGGRFPGRAGRLPRRQPRGPGRVGGHPQAHRRPPGHRAGQGPAQDLPGRAAPARERPAWRDEPRRAPPDRPRPRSPATARPSPPASPCRPVSPACGRSRAGPRRPTTSGSRSISITPRAGACAGISSSSCAPSRPSSPSVGAAERHTAKAIRKRGSLTGTILHGKGPGQELLPDPAAARHRFGGGPCGRAGSAAHPSI